MGQISHRTDIVEISNALHCSIVTTEEHGYSSGDFVRLTNLNGGIPISHGGDQLNNNRYKIVVTGLKTFFLKDPVTNEYINSTTFPPYVSGGYCNLIEQNFVYHGG